MLGRHRPAAQKGGHEAALYYSVLPGHQYEVSTHLLSGLGFGAAVACHCRL